MKKEKKITKKEILLSIIIPIIISFITSAIFSPNYLGLFAHFGIEKFQIEYADQCRTNYDITNALVYYGIIGERDSKYAPYANLACAQIHNEQQQYKKALEFYQKAVVSNDIRILSSCMNFVINQMNYSTNKKDSLNLFEDENIQFVVELMNKINELSPDTFKDYKIDFPIDESFVNEYLNPDSKITINRTYWKYDYTLVDTDGSLAHVKDNERLDYVTSWDESLNSTSFDTVTKYKYYHYVLETENKDVSTLNAIQDSLSEYQTIDNKPIKAALEEFENQNSTNK